MSSPTRFQASHDLVSWPQALNCAWGSEQYHVPQLITGSPSVILLTSEFLSWWTVFGPLKPEVLPDLAIAPQEVEEALLVKLCLWLGRLHALWDFCSPAFLQWIPDRDFHFPNTDYFTRLCFWLPATSSRPHVMPAGLGFPLAASAQAVPPTPDSAPWVEFQSLPRPVCPAPLQWVEPRSAWL